MGDLHPSRDLRGYRGRAPRFAWPNGARVAVSIVVNFEEGAERQVGDGDADSERNGEVLSVVEPGRRDLGQEQIFAYGLRSGFWRLAEALERERIAATFFMCGRAVERSPDLARAVAAAGHEPAAHGWRWRPHANYDGAAAEAHDLDRCIVAIETATGRRPRGFFCRGSESRHTRALLAERDFVYTSNGFDDDLPYRDGARRPCGRPLLVVPYALDTNDMKFFHPNGFVRAQEMLTYVEDALDVLLREAERGETRLLNVGFHLRIAGRPGRFKAFEGVLSLLRGHGERVFVATRLEIAEAFAAAVPEALAA